VWDRDELKGAVQDIIARRGEFFCLLGCKSTGKSLVIQHLEKLCLEGCNMGIVFVVNQRIEGSNILKGLMIFPEKRRNLLTSAERAGCRCTNWETRCDCFCQRGRT
jgi:hypothetical protein